jgi:hypothetical protein
MYKLFTQAQYDDNGTRRHLVNAVYTDDKQHPRLSTCDGKGEPVYDMDTNIKWWQCSTDELLCDDREYKSFLLCQEVEEVLDGSNSRITFVPDKRNIVFNKKGEIVLLCDDAEWCKILKDYGSIENYLKTQQTTLEF